MAELPDNVTLKLLGERLARLLAERETDRADMLTIVNMIQRTETSMALLSQQLNNMHIYNRSLGERLGRLEDTVARLETTMAAGFHDLLERLAAIESKLGKS
jgi:hypothetical protein